MSHAPELTPDGAPHDDLNVVRCRADGSIALACEERCQILAITTHMSTLCGMKVSFRQSRGPD